jgi:hypothetical protein
LLGKAVSARPQGPTVAAECEFARKLRIAVCTKAIAKIRNTIGVG